MKTIVICACCLFSNLLLSQNIDSSFIQKQLSPIQSLSEMDALDSALYASLNIHYQNTLRAELSELQTTTKGNWLKYLPTIGLTYTPGGKPRPTLNWSSNLIYTSQKQQQAVDAKRRAIIKKNELARYADLIKLDNLLRKRQYLLEDIAAQQQQLELDQQIFEIDQLKYENHQILPSEFLKAKRNFLKKEHSLRQRQQELIELQNRIYELARFRM